MKSIGYIVLLSFVISCGNKKSDEQNIKPTTQTPSLDSLSWIIGSWEMKTGNSVFIESWTKTNDSVFSGASSEINNDGDTNFTESISIERRGNDIYYIPTVQGQNNNSPVLFKCTSKSGIKMVFENPEHDFPQIITYKLKGDSLLAEISGTTEKVFHVESFPMVRRK